MEEYFSLLDIITSLNRFYTGNNYIKLVEYCKNELEKTNLTLKFSPEDIIQEAALKLLMRDRKIRLNSNFTTIFFMITKSIIHNHSYHFNNIITEVREKTDIYTNSSFDYCSRRKRQAFERSEANELKTRMLAKCKNDEEKLILFDMMESMSCKQISEDLGLSESKVKVIRKSLKERLEEFVVD